MFCHDKHTSWACHLREIEECLNNVIHDSTGFSSYFLQTGQNSDDDIQSESHQQALMLASERLKSKAERRRQKYDNTIKPIFFNEGDLVLVRTHPQSFLKSSEIKKNCSYCMKDLMKLSGKPVQIHIYW